MKKTLVLLLVLCIINIAFTPNSGSGAAGAGVDTSLVFPADYPPINASTASGTCWDISECPGQPMGDANCDGIVNLADLFALKAAWGQSTPWTPPYCCADFSQDGSVNLGDLFIFKLRWGTIVIGPSTGNQNCP